MESDWKTAAHEELLRLQTSDAGWGDQENAAPHVEPTALACLGLLASDPATPPRAPEEVRASAEWLAKIQRPDGSLGLSASVATPNWTTPYGILVWSALPGFSDPAERAKRWLLRQEGTPFVDHLGIFGHDTSIVGWSWTEGTHSWIEPTALAVLGLCRRGLGEHPRTRDGVRLIRDRAIAGGGWNYGNNSVFGHTLRPQPSCTGLALLALAGAGRPAPEAERAIAYLERVLPATRSAPSLGWGLLGLRAWGRAPDRAGRWLGEAHERVAGRPDAAPRLAHLLLASGERSLTLLGLSRPQTPAGRPGADPRAGSTRPVRENRPEGGETHERP